MEYLHLRPGVFLKIKIFPQVRMSKSWFAKLFPWWHCNTDVSGSVPASVPVAATPAVSDVSAAVLSVAVEPVVEAPVVASVEPVVEIPVVEAVVAEASVVASVEPVVEAPVVSASVEPVVEAPVVSASVEPVVETPVVAAPVDEVSPKTSEPSVAEPVNVATDLVTGAQKVYQS
jgi:hypothetical protein